MATNTIRNRSLRDVATHEAGHYVVAKAVGFQVLGLTIKRECNTRSEQFHGSANTVIVRPIANDEELDTYLMHRIMVLNAGALAQAFNGIAVDSNRLEEIREDNGSDDWGKAMDVFAIYLNRRFASDFGEYVSTHRWPEHPFWKKCDDDALKVLKENWAAIERIVADAEAGFKHPASFLYERPVERLEAIGRESSKA